MTSRQSRLRERRKAEGGKQLTCMLLPVGVKALEELQRHVPSLTLGQIVSSALVSQAVFLHRLDV